MLHGVKHCTLSHIIHQRAQCSYYNHYVTWNYLLYYVRDTFFETIREFQIIHYAISFRLEEEMTINFVSCELDIQIKLMCIYKLGIEYSQIYWKHHGCRNSNNLSALKCHPWSPFPVLVRARKLNRWAQEIQRIPVFGLHHWVSKK